MRNSVLVWLVSCLINVKVISGLKKKKKFIKERITTSERNDSYTVFQGRHLSFGGSQEEHK